MRAKRNVPIYFKVVPYADALCEEPAGQAFIKASAIGVTHVMEDNDWHYGEMIPVQQIEGKWEEVTGVFYGNYPFPCCFEMNGRNIQMIG